MSAALTQQAVFWIHCKPQIENSLLQVLKFVKIREFYVIFKIRKNS